MSLPIVPMQSADVYLLLLHFMSNIDTVLAQQHLAGDSHINNYGGASQAASN